MDLTLDPGNTALVIIDLQKGILGSPSVPHAGPDVVARAARMAEALKARGGLVVLVHVIRSADGRDALHPATDAPPTSGGRPVLADFSEIAPELVPHGSLVIGKRQWGAFYGTELDLQLRRRGIDTIVLCGISTTMGVESTARDAFERGYDQVFVEDAMSAREAGDHEHAVRSVFPRMGRIRSTEDVLAALR
jgi:nicotinamidase-related amidase